MLHFFKGEILHSGLKSDSNFTGGLPRYCEVILAIGGLIILSPVFIICIALVKVSSPGSILFRQQRVGYKGKPFVLYKFRTMFVSQKGLHITAENDRRVTPIGRFLRKSKLDELPELYNVIRGDMSFVGPRPEVTQLVDFTNSLWNEVLSVRPGITDPITLRLRNEETFLASAENKEKFYQEVIQPYKLNGYVKYLKVKTWKSDLMVIARTIKVVFLPKTMPPPTLEEIQLSYVE